MKPETLVFGPTPWKYKRITTSLKLHVGMCYLFSVKKAKHKNFLYNETKLLIGRKNVCPTF